VSVTENATPGTILLISVYYMKTDSHWPQEIVCLDNEETVLEKLHKAMEIKIILYISTSFKFFVVKM
jgi:hypothetical protein